MLIKEKQHRLSENDYKGEVSVSFTLCVKDRVRLFRDESIVADFRNILANLIDRFSCIIPIYCFMPDHQHVLVIGIKEKADTLSFIKAYKQSTGFWLSKNKIDARWQKDFFDHIVRKEENLVNVIKYILDNPVRKGLVENWQDYPFKGAIGCDLEEILQSLV